MHENKHNMLSFLLGSRGYYRYRHERKVWFDLALALTGDAPSISCATQEYTSDFIRRHGTRAARAYTRALLRTL